MKREKYIPIFIGVVTSLPLLLFLVLIVIFKSIDSPEVVSPKEMKEMILVTESGDTIKGRFEVLIK